MKHKRFKNLCAASTIIALMLTIGCQLLSDQEDERKWSFNSAELNSLPQHWKATETSGTGTPAVWEIISDESAPSPAQVVAVTKSENRGQTYNLLIAEDTSYQDVEVEVSVKAINGVIDQGGGPIWRALDEKNYYICRWNPLENNLRVYTVKNGTRKQIASADASANADDWHEIEIEHTGSQIIVEFDDKKVLSLEDTTFPQAGMVGLWTKADATTAFDDFEVEDAED